MTTAEDQPVDMARFVLLVEDEAGHIELIRRSFESQDIRLEVASSLAEARRFFAADPPDVALVDLHLPDGNGMDLLPPSGSREGVPLVIMTSHGDEQVAVAAMKRGALDYVVKSEVTLTDMPRTARRVVRQWHDMVQRERAEKALLESEARLQSIINTVPDIIYRLDRDGRIIFVSDAVRQYGYAPEELIGKTVIDLVHPEDKEKAVYGLNERRTGDRSTKALEVRLLTQDHKPIDFQIRSNPITDTPVLLVNAEGIYSGEGGGPGNWLGTQGVARDITEFKQLEKRLLQVQKMDAIGRMAGGIAHDFNNMLTVVLGSAEMLLFDDEDKEMRALNISLIQDAANRAAQLTRQILAFSRRQVLEPEVLDLGKVVDEVRSMLERLINENIKLEVGGPQDLHTVLADRGQLEQVIVNLVINARDAMPEGGIIRIETANQDVDTAHAERRPGMRPGAYVLLAVCDTGIGMDPETQARIFEPFFTTKERGQGTGMGLATVYGIIKQSDGYIEVHSEPGKGTTFQIYLPVRDGTAIVAPDRPAADQQVGGSETILLVEDEELVRTQVARQLNRLGYTVLWAADGQEALQVAARQLDQVDLLLTDVVMPQMGGKELVGRLRQQRPQLRVIYMSGYTDQTFIDRNDLDEGSFYLPKPFSMQVLSRTVREAIDGEAA